MSAEQSKLDKFLKAAAGTGAAMIDPNKTTEQAAADEAAKIESTGGKVAASVLGLGLHAAAKPGNSGGAKGLFEQQVQTETLKAKAPPAKPDESAIVEPVPTPNPGAELTALGQNEGPAVDAEPAALAGVEAPRPGGP